MKVDPDAKVEDISVGMQQRVEILKMLYRDNEILIFDEPTAVLTPQEIDELMDIMRGFKAEGKSILFITHKLNEIMAVADRCTVLQKGRGIGTVDIANTTKEELSRIIIAYEPVWAIGTGKTATADQADEVNGFIRSVVAGLYGKDVAEAMTIQYGGSMNAKNAEELLCKEHVDGGLIGGASLKAEDFSIIVKAASK